MRNKKVDGMIVATFLTTVFYSSAYPYIHKEIIMSISDQLIALNQIINCLSVVIFGILWNKYSDKLFIHYPTFCILETILNVGSTIWAIAARNLAAYYMIDTIIFAIVTRNICCGGVKLRALRYASENEREHFDNNNNSASAIASILGSLIAMVLELNFEVMLCIATFGNVIDNIFYFFIYKSTTKKS